jgi:hypothetical protein
MIKNTLLAVVALLIIYYTAGCSTLMRYHTEADVALVNGQRAVKQVYDEVKKGLTVDYDHFSVKIKPYKLNTLNPGVHGEVVIPF